MNAAAKIPEGYSRLPDDVKGRIEAIETDMLQGIFLRDRQSILDSFIYHSHNILQAESAAIFLTAKDDANFLILDSSYTDKFKYSIQRYVHLPIQRKEKGGLTGCIAFEKKTVRLNGQSLYNNPYTTNSNQDHLVSGICQSLLAIPLLNGKSELMGLLKYENKKFNGQCGDNITFTNTDEVIATRLGTRVVALLEALERFTLFSGIENTSFRSIPRESILLQSLKMACSLCKYDSGMIFVSDDNNKILRCVSLWAPDAPDTIANEFKQRYDDDSIASLVFHQNIVISSHDPQNDPRCNSRTVARLNVKSPLIAVPLNYSDIRVGVLILWNPTSGDSPPPKKAIASGAEFIASHLARFSYERSIDAAYHSLLDPLPVGIFRKDIKGRIIFCNRHFYTILDRPISEIIGKTDAELFPQELARKFMLDDKFVLAGNDFEDIERNRNPDGRPLFVHVVKKPMRNAQGEIIGLQGAFLDVTKLKLFDQQSQAQKMAKLGSLEWDFANDILTGSDELYNILEINPAHKYSINPDLLDMIVPEDRGRVYETINKLRETPSLFNITFGITASDKSTHILLAQAEPVMDTDGHIVRMSGTIQDITERKAEEYQAIQSEKLQSLGKITGTIAHDLRSPLTAVQHGLAYLKMHCVGESVPSTDVISALSNSINAVDRALAMINLLIKFSIDEKPIMEKHEIANIIEGSLSLVQRELSSHRITLNKFNLSDLPFINCCATQINSLFVNIVTNSIEAMPDGGTITVSGGVGTIAESDPKVFQETVKPCGFYVRITVEDTGPGFDDKILSQAFKIGNTSKPLTGGSGLGLYSCSKIIELHDGYIFADNKPMKKGAIITILFPALKR